MVTRIPQPQFVGPTPAGTVESAGTLGMESAKLFAQGIQEGARNYYMQKQLAQEKDIANMKEQGENTRETQREISEMDRLRLTVQANSLQQYLKEAGPGNEGKVFMEHYNEFKNLYRGLANGNAELADSMLQGTAKTLNSMSPITQLQMGLIGPQTQAQAPQQAPGIVPPTGANAAPPPAPMAAETAQTSAPYLRVFPSAGGNFNLPKQSAATQGSNLTDQSASVSSTITQSVPVATPKTKLAQEVINKFETGGFQANDQLTPKEIAATKATINQVYKPLENSAVRDYLDKGGSMEALQRGADLMTEAMKDPGFAEWAQTTASLSPADAKEFLASQKENRAYETMVNNFNLALGRLDVSRGQVMLKAAQLDNSYMMALLKATETNDKTSLGLLNAGVRQFATYAGMWKDETDKFRAANKGVGEDAVKKHMDQMFADPTSGLSVGLGLTATILSKALNQPVEVVTVALKEDPGYFQGLLDRAQKFFAGGGGGAVEKPVVPGANPKPAAPKPQGQGGAAPAVPKQYTQKQLDRMARGQAPGNPD